MLSVEELAEDLMAYIPLPCPPGDRLVTDRARLTFRPGLTPFFATVNAVRARDAADLTELAAECVAWFRARGREDFYWFLGPSATPADAVEVLTALGATVAARGTAMMIDRAPDAEVGDADIRLITSPAELLEFRVLTGPAGGTADLDSPQRETLERSNDEAWAEIQAMGARRNTYLAWVDGAPAAGAALMFADDGTGILAGGATASWARGRGLYRSLVARRWEDAVAAGASALVTQASDQSQPILAALGFTACANLTLMRQTV